MRRKLHLSTKSSHIRSQCIPIREKSRNHIKGLLFRNTLKEMEVLASGVQESGVERVRTRAALFFSL